MSIFATDPLAGVHVQVGRVVAWWLGELRSAFGEAASLVTAIAPNTLTIEAGERRWVLRRKQRSVGTIDWETADAASGSRRLQELAVQGGRPGAVLVKVPPERVLSTIVDLPAGARGELDRILAFEISRHFPFPAERVLYRYRIIRRSAEATGLAPPLSVEIVAVPREVVASIVDAVAAAGLRARQIGLISAPGATPLFLPVDALATPQMLRPENRRLAAAVAVLALAAAISWPVEQQVRLAAIEREATLLRPQAEAALHVRERRQLDADQTNAIARLRGGRPPAIAILDSLTRDVPDGSWLTSLTIAGRDIVLEGLSPSAATIALALGRDPSFAGVVFRSPITRDAATGLEHFQLGVTIAQRRP